MCCIRFVFLFLFCCIFCMRGEASLFKEYNPDGKKYEFSKAFISALSYYARVAERLRLEDNRTIHLKPDVQAIKQLVDHRTLDNTELRIARNYLNHYVSFHNGLIRKIAVDSVGVYDRLLFLSGRERDLWMVFLRYKMSGQPSDFNERAFNEQQIFLAQEKKETAKSLLKSAVFLTKAMLSARLCDKEDCKALALTQGQRDKLLVRLDSFSGGNMDWGMKPGQSTVEACTAVIREVLEDPLYLSWL